MLSSSPQTATFRLPTLRPPSPSTLIVALTVFTWLVVDYGVIESVVANQPLGVDLLPIWTAVRMEGGAEVYDFVHITELQVWLFERALRPFVNPPSAIPILAILGTMPFFVAYSLFISFSSAFFLWTSQRIGADWRLVLMPHVVVLVALVGQVTFLIGGLVMLALTLPRRPLIQGLLFAIAGAIKPQMLVLLPVALVAGRYWRAFVATGIAGSAFILLSILFNADWTAWLDALGRFRHLAESDASLARMSATPYTMFGPSSLWATIPLALTFVWMSFRRGYVPLQVLALFAGAILISPYALAYEVALLVPAILALEPAFRWSLLFWLALALLASPVWAVFASVIVGAVCLGRGVVHEKGYGSPTATTSWANECAHWSIAAKIGRAR